MAPWEPYTVNEDEEARYQEEERLVHQDLYSIQHQDRSYFNSEPTCETVEEIFRASPFCQNEDCVDITVHQPDESKYFFIIRKEWRHGRDNEDEHTDTVAVYYCIGGTIYQCPDLSSLLKYRLVGRFRWWVFNGSSTTVCSPSINATQRSSDMSPIVQLMEITFITKCSPKRRIKRRRLKKQVCTTFVVRER